MKNFDGDVLFLDRSDINTDEIIPAKYLTENTKNALKPYLLEDLNIDGFDPGKDVQGKCIIVTKENFGCGSSREHAPWALEVNGINLVIAVSFARIFKQNMFNCGMMAVKAEKEQIEKLFKEFAGRKTTVKTDFEKRLFHFKSGDKEYDLEFTISGFDEALVKAGGWVEYADSKY
jgi:3-isopropylmalate/(R)-2-methylmalate dehydratase small subunit